MIYICPQCGPDPRGSEVHAREMHTFPVDTESVELRRELTALRTREAAFREALEEVDEVGCTNYVGKTRCFDANTGRTRGAKYTAEAWCDACIARFVLAAHPTQEPETP